MRKCDGCTKCCEGYLWGQEGDHKFFYGQPFYFLEIGKGCTIWPDRPKDPCQDWFCEWIKNEDWPVWMKPDKSNVILTGRYTASGIPYLEAQEAGEPMKATVLSYILLYALNNNINIKWVLGTSSRWYGSEEFVEEMANS